MKKFLTLATLATLALTSCNNDNDVPVTDSADGPEIRFDAQALTVDTKAPFEGNISETNKLTALVVGSETSNNYGTPYTDGTNEAKGDVVFADQGITQSGFTNAVKWPTDVSKVLYFRGFYPGGNAWTVGESTATAIVDGKSDLMGTTEISGTSTSSLHFGFTHLLTKLHVKVVGTTAAATTWGTITKIELSQALKKDPAEKVMLTYSSGSAAFTSEATAVIPFYKASASGSEPTVITYKDDLFSTIPIPETPTLVAYSLVPPVVAKAGSGDEQDEYTLKITTSQGAGTSGKEVNINLRNTSSEDLVGSTNGMKFDITIHFSAAGEITATATVTDWVDGGEGSGNM